MYISNWKCKEPNDKGVMYCMPILGDNCDEKWNDDECSDLKEFVCEYHLS